MDIFIEQLEEATGLGAVMDLLQDLLGGATDPAFLAVVAVAGRRRRLAPRWLSTEQPSRPRHWLWWSTAVRPCSTAPASEHSNLLIARLPFA